MKRFHVTLLLVVLSVVVTAPSHASTSPTEKTATLQLTAGRDLLQLRQPGVPASTPQAAQLVSETTTRVFLPLVGHGRDIRPTCSPASPFSLQIAALHQVEPGGAGGAGTEAFPTLTEALEASGACWARVRVNWAWIQPDPPPADYVWAPYHDDRLRLVAEAGVRLIAHVDNIPGWASDLACGPIDPNHLDEYAQFLTDLVNHYKQPPWNIHHWELFNEPDGTWPEKANAGIGCWGYYGEAYARMLAVAYPAIKSADPEATVLMGGMAYDAFIEYGGPFYRYFSDDMVAHGGARYLDAFNLHSFPDFNWEWQRWDANNHPTCGIIDDGQGSRYEAGGIDVIAKVNHFRNRMGTCFGVAKPIWVTELAEHGRARDPASLAKQARYVIQGYARGLAAGIQNITWFALVTPPYDEAEQGLLYDDWTPKPAFYAYQVLARELMDHTYAYTLDVPGVEGYVFRDAQAQEKTVVWGSGRVTFGGASRLRIADRHGNVIFVADGDAGDADGTQNGAVVLQTTADPVFVSR